MDLLSVVSSPHLVSISPIFPLSENPTSHPARNLEVIPPSLHRPPLSSGPASVFPISPCIPLGFPYLQSCLSLESVLHLTPAKELFTKCSPVGGFPKNASPVGALSKGQSIPLLRDSPLCLQSIFCHCYVYHSCKSWEP